ncbi:InlB B-repeat-containing protein [Anaerorhabdus sp.]|uniref:InlB B-repeat-containing protein n=1 Tax=Anaerorhabdus sp. TaxID=1872524 RepID=UPI002FC670FB
MKKLTIILSALLIALTTVNPTIIFAEDELNNDEQEINQEVILEEEPVETATPEPIETSLPEATKETEVIDNEVVAMQMMGVEFQNINTPNITIQVNIDKAVITLTENNQSADIPVVNGVATATCISTCVVDINGKDATLKTAEQNNQTVYTLSEPYQNKITMNFDGTANQTASAIFGYKLTVTTHYLTTTGPNVNINGGIIWNSAVTVQKMQQFAADAPTTYTKILLPGEAIEMYPQPAASGNFPLRLLHYQGVVTSGNAAKYLVPRRVKSGAMASDDTNTWFEQSQASGITTTNVRYFGLSAMPTENVTVDYAYNYTKKAFFVGLTFEQIDGSFKNEEFKGSNQAYPTYHLVDFVVDGKEEISFNPKESIFGDQVKFPANTDQSDYTLQQVYAMADANYTGFIYYNQWSDEYNTMGSNNMNTISGLNFAKDGSGTITGIFTQRLETRNYFLTYQFILNRPLNYYANNSTTNVQSEIMFANQQVAIKNNMFTYDGHTFVGWNTEKDGSGTAYAPNDNFTMKKEKEVNLYAQWEVNAPKPTPITPTPTPVPPMNTGCPDGTTWDEGRQQCLAPAIIPVQPNNTQPQQPEDEVIIDEQTPEQGNQQIATPTPAPEEKIVENVTPEVGGRKSWALVNLIATLLGLVFAILLMNSKHEKEEIEEQENEEKEMFFERKGIYKWISGIIAIASILVFVFTENMRLPMKMVDRYTILMLVFLLINAVTFYFGRKWHENEEEEEVQHEQ